MLRETPAAPYAGMTVLEDMQGLMTSVIALEIYALSQCKPLKYL
jgi:hypothetical protein